MTIRLVSYRTDQEPPHHDRLILDHPFNRTVSFILSADADLRPLDLGFSLTHNVRLVDFLNMDFLAYLRTYPGECIALSTDTSITDDPMTFGLGPRGILWLNVSTKAYMRFGLEGEPLARKSNERFLIRLNLMEDHWMKAEGKMRLRALSRISEIFGAPYSTAFAFVDRAAAERFTTATGHLITFPVVAPAEEVLRREALETMMPNFPAAERLEALARDDDVGQGECLELDQWMGALVNGCAIDAKKDPFISTFGLDPLASHPSTLTVLSFDGSPFIHPGAIQRMFKDLCNGRAFAGIIVKGCDNAPITWNDFPNCEDRFGVTQHGYTVASDASSRHAISFQYTSGPHERCRRI